MTLNRSISKHIKRSLTSVGSLASFSSSPSSPSLSVGKQGDQGPKDLKNRSITHLTLQTNNSQADLQDRFASYSRSHSRSASSCTPSSAASSSANASSSVSTPLDSPFDSAWGSDDHQKINGQTDRSTSLPSLSSPGDSASDRWSGLSDECDSVVEEEPFAATKRMSLLLARMNAQSRPLSIISDDLSVYNVPFTGLSSDHKQVEMDFGLPEGFYKVDVEEYLRDLRLTVQT